MKNFSFTLLVGFVLFVTACSTPKVYLVRHAEKSTSPANDPHLSQVGLERATELAKILGSKKIEAIYSTNTSRTRETAASLCEKLGLSIQYYAPDTTAKIANWALMQKKNTLIVGHSNTLLPVINALGLNASKKEIPDSEYDNLFIIYRKHGKLKLVESKYGQISNPAANPLAEPTMK